MKHRQLEKAANVISYILTFSVIIIALVMGTLKAGA